MPNSTTFLKTGMVWNGCQNQGSFRKHNFWVSKLSQPEKCLIIAWLPASEVNSVANIPVSHLEANDNVGCKNREIVNTFSNSFKSSNMIFCTQVCKEKYMGRQIQRNFSRIQQVINDNISRHFKHAGHNTELSCRICSHHAWLNAPHFSLHQSTLRVINPSISHSYANPNQSQVTHESDFRHSNAVCESAWLWTQVKWPTQVRLLRWTCEWVSKLDFGPEPVSIIIKVSYTCCEISSNYIMPHGKQIPHNFIYLF